MPGLQVTPIPILHYSRSHFRVSREQGWIASGSFDRTIKLWDLSRSSKAQPTQPIVTFTPPESSGPKASVYALAVDPLGNTVVSGGPERVIRMWDPRVGRRIGKLVGHTDNIRAILISEDARCVGCNLPFYHIPLISDCHYSYSPLLQTVCCVIAAYNDSLMVIQLRSSYGPSPRSGAYIPLRTIPILSGRFTHHIRPSKSFTQATSLASLPRLTSRVTRTCRRENARSFVKTLRHQLKASLSLSPSTTYWYGPRAEAQVCGGGVYHHVGLSALPHFSKHSPPRYHAFAHHAAQNHAHDLSHLNFRHLRL